MSKEKAARAGAWSALDIVLRQGLQFGVSIVLARLLAPEDFGLVALLGLFTNLSIVFVQGGLTMALIQRQESTREEESAVFWVNLGASVLFALLLLGVAPFVARFYGLDLLAPLMAVAAAQVVLSALGAVQAAMLTRSLRFDQLTKAGIVSSLLSGTTSIAAAAAGWGPWALAVQMVVAAATSTAALWSISRWRPILRLNLSALRNLIGFGSRVGVSSILEVIYAHGFNLVIGKLYGLRELGLWSRASGVNTLPVSIISQIIARTAFPLFASRASDAAALRRGFQLALGLCMFLSLPLMMGLCLLSDLVIATLFGPKWTDASPLLAVMALSGMLLPLQVLNLELLLAVGGSKTFLRIEIWKKLAGIAIIGPACFFGTMAIAYAAFVFSILAYLINAWPTGKSIDYGPVAQIAGLRGVFIAVAAMSASVLAIKPALTLSPATSLIVLTIVGGAVYLTTAALLRESSFVTAFDLAKKIVQDSVRRWQPEGTMR